MELKIYFLLLPATVKQRTEDILQLRRNIKDKDEVIQQRDIDISCLRGQVANIIREHLTVDEIDSEALGLGDPEYVQSETFFNDTELVDGDEDSDTLTYAANGSGSDEEILLEDLETDAE